MCGTDCFLMLLAVLFPPIGVWVKRGVCSADSLINLALCCLGFLPGLLHAWYIILQNPDPYAYESVNDGGERQGQRHADGSVTYYYVSAGGPPRQAGIGAPNYGTVGNGNAAPSGGQFPGQQSGVANPFAGMKKGDAKKGNKGAAQGAQGQGAQGAPGEQSYAQVVQEGEPQEGGEGSSGPAGPPPTYADVIKGDHKVQKP